MADSRDSVPQPSTDDLNRIRELFSTIGGKDVVWGAAHVLEVHLTECRLRAERLASSRLIRATWVLAVSTVVLALATIGLIVATVAET